MNTGQHVWKNTCWREHLSGIGMVLDSDWTESVRKYALGIGHDMTLLQCSSLSGGRELANGFEEHT